MRSLIGIIGLISILSGCAIHDEVLYIGGDLITVRMQEGRPKVRVSTGIHNCKWRGRVSFSDMSEGNHQIWIKCRVETNSLVPKLN